MLKTKQASRRKRRLEAAEGYLILSMPDHALRELDAIDDPDQCALRAYRLRAEALRDKCQHRDALKAYSRALVEDPDNVSILLGMAWCYKRTDRLTRAIAAMRRAYRISPDEAIVLYNLACYYALAGEKAEALSWLGRALRKDGDLRKLIPDESDFDGLRDDPDFQFVAGSPNVSDSR